MTALALDLSLLQPAQAQTFTTLYGFTDRDPITGTNTDGANPNAVILSGNTLYATTFEGGSVFSGTVFAVNTDGMDFTNLHSLLYSSDGYSPQGGMVLSGNTLYGTASAGGVGGNGTIFSITTDGTVFSILHVFSGTDGSGPGGQLFLSGDTLYGTTSLGGANFGGSVFAIKTNGTFLFTNLYSFTQTDSTYGTNSDGGQPSAGVVLSGSTLYGVTSVGGRYADGTVFAVNTDGTGFTNLHTFTGNPTDGASPRAELIVSGNTLYGTGVGGGTHGNGSVFAIQTDGTGFTNLYSFTTQSGLYFTNSDGAGPQGKLFLSGNTLYGTAVYGGMYGWGTVFALNINGTGFTSLHNFTGSDDGANPMSGVIVRNNTLYGTAFYGGSSGYSGNGTVFSLSLEPAVGAPQLTINRLGTNVLLTWLAAGFVLQSTTNLVSPVWITVPGQNTVTNPISGIRKFYRLSQ